MLFCTLVVETGLYFRNSKYNTKLKKHDSNDLKIVNLRKLFSMQPKFRLEQIKTTNSSETTKVINQIPNHYLTSKNAFKVAARISVRL